MRVSRNRVLQLVTWWRPREWRVSFGKWPFRRPFVVFRYVQLGPFEWRLFSVTKDRM